MPVNLAKEALEPAHLGDLGAVEAKAAGDLGEVTAPVDRVIGVAAGRAEFVRLGAVAAVVQGWRFRCVITKLKQ